MTNRLRLLPGWLAEARYLWIAVAVIGIAVCFLLREGATEPITRLTGLVLQVLGIGTVIWGIRDTRTFFRHPSYLSLLSGWLSRFPLLKQKAIVGLSGVALVSIAGKGRAHVVDGAGENATVEARLSALEKNIGYMHERISEAQKEYDRGVQEVAVALKTEKDLRQSEDTKIRAKLEVVGTGGLNISAVGASWLFVGVVLSTASPEITQMLKHFQG